MLNNLVSGYFDFAEFQVMKYKPMYMKDYLRQLDNILKSIDAKVLDNAGTISHKNAIDKAKEEYKKYQVKEFKLIELEYLNSIKEINKEISKIEKSVKNS